MSSSAGKAFLGLLMAALLAGPAFAHSEGHRHTAAEREKPAGVTVQPAEVRLPRVELLDQDGRTVTFPEEVIGGRIAVIDVIYTNCGLVCPILSAILADLQDALGDRLGKDVSLVSVSVDPLTDIPPRLKEYAARFGARPGWTFLTGSADGVTQVLKSLGAYNADFTQHPAMILVGEAGKADWSRYYGFPSTVQLLGRIDELASRRGEKAAGAVR